MSEFPFCTAMQRQFRVPRHVVSGDGSAASIVAVLREVEGSGDLAPVLFVVDADLLKLGLAGPVSAVLEEAGRIERWSPPPGEPRLESARELARVARALQPGAVVGLGGGSALDLAKVAAAAVTNDDPVDTFIGLNRIARDPVPLILIPTTAGTGSEVTGVSMLASEGHKAVISSTRLVPVAAILDPLLTVSLPPAQTAATGLDALSHALESLLSTYATALTASAAVGAAGLLTQHLEGGYRDGQDLVARRALLSGAHLAGLALNASVVIGHSIAYTIANRTGLPHGVTCALALPYCLRYNAVPGDARLAQALLSMGDVYAPSAATGTRPADRVTHLAIAVRALATRLQIPPSLEAVGIAHRAVPEMAAECLALYARPNNPLPVTERDLLVLYEHLYVGDLEGYRGPA